MEQYGVFTTGSTRSTCLVSMDEDQMNEERNQGSTSASIQVPVVQNRDTTMTEPRKDAATTMPTEHHRQHLVSLLHNRQTNDESWCY
jgi:hypothetical protein